MATIIEKGAPVVTLINIFTVDPERQEELIRLLDEATDKAIRNLPGFVSANIHRGLDERHVANYAQWESREAFESMLANPAAQQHMRAATAISHSEPLLYQVASVHSRR